MTTPTISNDLLSASMIPTERLEAEIASLAAHLTAAMCEWLLLVAEYDRRRAFESWECVSMVQWLSMVGISPVTARQHVAVARRLGELPAVREAFAKGEVSFSRSRHLSYRDARYGRHAPRPHRGWPRRRRWISIVSDTARALKALEPRHAERQAAERHLSWWFDEDGMCRVRGVLPPEVGAQFVAAGNGGT